MNNSGCYGNGKIIYSWNEFILGKKNTSNSLDPMIFGTHENLSRGAWWTPHTPGLVVSEMISKEFYLKNT